MIFIVALAYVNIKMYITYRLFHVQPDVISYTVNKFGVSKKTNIFIQQGCIKMITSESNVF